jgi:hypothetical protein
MSTSSMMSSTSSRKRLTASPDDAGRRLAAGPGEQSTELRTFTRSSVWTPTHQYGHVPFASQKSAWRRMSTATKSTSSHAIRLAGVCGPLATASNTASRTRPVRIGVVSTRTHSHMPTRYRFGM